MARAQFPIDGKLGKDFKATSLMGMRIHPVTKEKKHHNGTDIVSKHKNVSKIWAGSWARHNNYSDVNQFCCHTFN